MGFLLLLGAAIKKVRWKNWELALSFFILQRFKGYHCESDIPTCKWKVI